MIRLFLASTLALALAGCADHSDGSQNCVVDTDDCELQLSGDDLVALGGTGRVLVFNESESPVVGAAMSTESAVLSIVSQASNQVTVRGDQLGSGEVDAASSEDPAEGSAGGMAVWVSTIDQVVLAPSTALLESGIDIPASATYAFASTNVAPELELTPATLPLSPTIYGGTLTDTSMVIDGPTGGAQTAWNDWTGTLAAGTYSLVAHSGAATVTTPLQVVDHADRIVLLSNEHGTLCFAAMSGATRVLGFTWSITGDTAPGTNWPDCGSYAAASGSVTATAGGATLTATWPQ